MIPQQFTCVKCIVCLKLPYTQALACTHAYAHVCVGEMLPHCTVSHHRESLQVHMREEGEDL